MKLTINHTTTYVYHLPASYALQQLRLRPQSSRAQSVSDWVLELEGAKLETEFTDHFSNHVSLISLSPEHETVHIHVSGTVETLDNAGVTGAHEMIAPLWFFKRQTSRTHAGKGVKALCRQISGCAPDAIAPLHDLSNLIADSVPYEIGATTPDMSAEDAIETGAGVCQDHAHIFISAARHLGYPARYVSGYLMMNDRIDQEATHAWAEAYVEGLGWVGFDVSNRISPDARYVHIANGLDYSDAAPSSGILLGGQQENLIVSVQVQQ